MTTTDILLLIIGIISIILIVILIYMVMQIISSKSKSQSDVALFAAFKTQLENMTAEQIRFIGFNNTEMRATIKELTDTVRESMREMRIENAKNIDEVRKTVGEKLDENIDKKFNESFGRINEQLVAFSKGLGEMQSLSTDVVSLKKILSNVKNRGVWGEISLGNLLEQTLTEGQYEKEFIIKPHTTERVDYAVVLPGRQEEKVYLPIDSKFPIEDYQRLIVASENSNEEEVKIAVKALNSRLRDQAKSISEKYIDVPKTTDFAIMYLATEGLFAEAVRNTGLLEEVQRKYRVIFAGPTTLTALLNSLSMGFKTVAIERRSSEINKLFGAFKKDFATFSSLLNKTKTQLQTVTTTINSASDRTRIIEKKLKDVEEIPDKEAASLLGYEVDVETN